MKLDQIMNLWEEDTHIDRSDLSTEALRIPKLHHKYYDIYVKEVLRLRKMETELKTLKLQKYEFLTQGPTKDQFDSGWKMPASGRILKSEVSNYLEADKDVINMTLNIALQKEKVDLLDSIIKSLKDRGYLIKNAIEFERFRNGG